jgi:hypothetical protein
MSQIKEIMANKAGWSQATVTLTEQLDAMKNSYATLAATFSQHLYLLQDELELDEEDIVFIQKELASIRQQINSNADAMVKRIIINDAGPIPNSPPEP